MTKPIPDGYHAVTPSFTFKDSQKAIAFYQNAFDAKVLFLMKRPDGKGVMHATIRIGDSILMMGDEMTGAENCAKSAETLGSSPISLYLYVSDADALFKRAVAAGGKAEMPVTDMFWGDRVGSIRDPFGYMWMIGTHTRDLTDEQVRQGAGAFFAQMAQQTEKS
jgi:PhnB protein